MPGKTAIAALAVLALLAANAPGSGAQALAASRSCEVVRVEGGSVRYLRGDDWVALTVRELPPGATRVVTGAQTRVRIHCSDGVVIAVGYDTEVDLTRLAGPAGEAESVLLDLYRGIIGILAPQRSWSDFQVRTPVAIASVRSTEWLVQAKAEGGAAIFVRRGTVEVAARTGRALLAAGEGVDVAPDGSLGPVAAWGEARIARSSGMVGFDWP